MSNSTHTEETFANAVYEAMRARGLDIGVSAIPRIRLIIPTALELLGERVKNGRDFRKMQADYSVTPVAGVINLVPLDGILFDIDKATVRVSATNARLHPVDDIWTLEFGGLPSDQVYYAEDGRTLRVRSTTPSLTDYVTPVKVRSNYKPSLTDATRPLPDSFEGAGIETAIELLTAAPPAVEMAKE